MNKFLKRFLIVLGILLVLLITAAALVSSLFEDKIGKSLISNINKQIDSELSVEKFDLSILSTFPSIAANLRGVQLQGKNDSELLAAENLSFRMGLFALLSSKIDVKSVVLSNGKLNLAIDRKGQGNFDIMKASSSSDEEKNNEDSDLNISLASARLDNIEIKYVDKSTKQDLGLLVTDASFSGEFSSKKFTLVSDALLLTRYFEMDQLRYLSNKTVSYDAKLFIDLEEGVYRFDQADLEVETNLFKVDGSIETNKNSNYFDLFLSCEKGSLASVLRLLPTSYAEQFGGIKSKGKFIFNAEVKGESSKRKNPAIQVELSLENGKISSPQMDSDLKNVSFIAHFDNGAYQHNKSSTFEIQEFTGYFEKELMELDLKIRNFDDPQIRFHADGVLPMNSIYGLMNNPKITDGSGEIEIRELKVDGRYKDMISTSRISKVDATGRLTFDDASLTINKEKMLIDKGVLSLIDNTLKIGDFKLEGADSELEFNGSAYNLIPVLFSDKTKKKTAELEFQAELVSKKLDIDRLLGVADMGSTEEELQLASTSTQIDSTKIAQIQKREKITSYLKGKFNATIDEYNYGKVEGKDFAGKLEFDNNELIIDGKTEAMNGSFDLDGHMYFEQEPYLKAKLTCNQINVSEFFRQTDNFGQSVLTNEHLQGVLNAKITIEAHWDERGTFLDDRLRVMAGVGLTEGELKDFEMLEGFSQFVNIKDLRHIKFTNIQNFLEVRNRRLYIPAMFIQSNALNLTISGEHSFDQEIQYNIKVNAGQVVVNKFKRHDPNLAPKKARRKGWFNLYYAILGNIDDYNIKSAKRRVKSDFELSEFRKKEIREALEKEFGYIALVEEPTDWKEIPEYNDDTDSENVEYIDWNDN